jgi:hypothetical protein
MSARIFVILLVIVGGTVVKADEQYRATRKPTLVERARQHGGIESSSIACGFRDGPPTLERLVRTAEVIVHGTVVEATGRLTDDQQDVRTDYTVQPTTVVHDQTSDQRVLGSSQPPYFTTRGGTVMVEGLKISITAVVHSSQVRLAPGDEVILFGRSQNGRFEFEPFEVFLVHAGSVRSNGRWPELSADRRAVPLGAFLATVGSHAVPPNGVSAR